MKKDTDNAKFTLDDWVNDRFCFEKDNQGNPVLNDSEKYLDLVLQGKMTYETINQIQDVQAKVYQWILENTKKNSLPFYRRIEEQSLDLEWVIKDRLNRINKSLNKNKEILNNVLTPSLHRGIKYGAKFISSADYKEYEKGSRLDAFMNIPAAYQIGNDSGRMKSFPTKKQRLYLVFEALVQRKRFLEDELDSLINTTKFDKCKRLEELFSSLSKYKQVMEILVSNNCVQPNTYFWKDNKKGNKSFVAAIIKDLHGKGYFKSNKKPTNTQIQQICTNTFGWDVGLETIKRARCDNFVLDFIPLASTLD